MDPTTEDQIDEPRRQVVRRWSWLVSRWLPFSWKQVTSASWWKTRQPTRAQDLPSPTAPRLLFLDDDPQRAAIFLKENPQAVWVRTVSECLHRLKEPWHEIHLDHDLGGKVFVDSAAEDCGMEVIRWLCIEPRPHLKEARFFVHTHHTAAGLLMVLQMRLCEYKAEYRPFGFDLERLLAHNEPPEGNPE